MLESSRGARNRADMTERLHLAWLPVYLNAYHSSAMSVTHSARSTPTIGGRLGKSGQSCERSHCALDCGKQLPFDIYWNGCKTSGVFSSCPFSVVRGEIERLTSRYGMPIWGLDGWSSGQLSHFPPTWRSPLYSCMQSGNKMTIAINFKVKIFERTEVSPAP